VLGRRPAPTSWETASQNTLVPGSPTPAAKDRFPEHLPTPNKFDSNGSTSIYPGYGGQAPVVPSYMQQPPTTSHHPYPAVPQPVFHALPRNPHPQQVPFHRRGGSEVTLAEQWTYGHPPRDHIYSPKRSSSIASSAITFVPERIVTPELLQRPITPSSILALEMRNPRSTSPNQHRRNISRMTSGDGLSGAGSLAPPPRPVTSHSPSTSIGSRSERGFKGTGGEQSVENQNQLPSSWKGPSRGVALSAVLGPQDAPTVPPTPTQLAQRSPYSPRSPFASGHRRAGSRPGFL
jgi:hypothetical protein